MTLLGKAHPPSGRGGGGGGVGGGGRRCLVYLMFSHNQPMIKDDTLGLDNLSLIAEAEHNDIFMKVLDKQPKYSRSMRTRLTYLYKEIWSNGDSK
jgi:hypothetical protein